MKQKTHNWFSLREASFNESKKKLGYSIWSPKEIIKLSDLKEK